MTTVAKRVLLIENLSRYYEDIIQWLTEKGYQVDHASDESLAYQRIENEHYHLIITDLYLDHPIKRNHGKQIVEMMKKNERYLELPIIVITGYPDVDELAELFQDLDIFRYVNKQSSYEAQLLDSVEKAFQKRVTINFLLDYRGTESLVSEIATDVQPDVAKKIDVSAERLVPQVRDVLGRLFYEADGINIEKLNPGLTGAALIRVDAHWPNIGWGPQCVTKIGRRDKINRENERYNKYVRNHLHNNVPANVAVAYSYDIGGVLYRLAEGTAGPLYEFDKFYQRRSAYDIDICLQKVFGDTCFFWYDHPDEPDYVNLPQHYFEAFNSNLDYLISRVSAFLPDFSPTQPTLKFPGAEKPILNPIYWLGQHLNEYRLRVPQCTTHGDLTGRNMMVDPDAPSSALQCWLIDFYRTGKSHILRDFAILETDITYRLWATSKFSEFFQVAVMLNENSFKKIDIQNEIESDAQKAYRVLASLRALGMSIARGAKETELNRKAYWVSLLMTTLNVVRLNHIAPEQKCQALVAASLYCNELDQIAHRQYTTLELAGVETLFHSVSNGNSEPNKDSER